MRFHSRPMLIGAGALALVAGGILMSRALNTEPVPAAMVGEAPAADAPAAVTPTPPAPPPPAATLATAGPRTLNLRVIEYVGGPQLTGWTANGVTTTLADVFNGTNLNVVVNRQPPIAAHFMSTVLLPSEVHNLLTSAPAAAPGSWEVTAYMMPVAHATGDLGEMFDVTTRRQFAVFGPAHAAPDRARKLLQTAAHELGHALNLFHNDADGDPKCCTFRAGFTQIGTSIMNTNACLAPGLATISLCKTEVEHLLFHDMESVRPGSAFQFDQCPWPNVHRHLC